MKNRSNPENCRLLNTKYLATEKGKAARARATKLYRQRNALKLRATNLVAYAIKKGTLIRLPCFVCGAPNAHGHHPDYSRPLDVIWLCQTHHKETHALVSLVKA